MVEGLVGLSVSQSQLHHTLAPRWGTPQLASQLLASDLAASRARRDQAAFLALETLQCGSVILLTYGISIALAAPRRPLSVRHHPGSSVTGQLPCPVVPFPTSPSAQSARCVVELTFQQPGLFDVN